MKTLSLLWVALTLSVQAREKNQHERWLEAGLAEEQAWLASAPREVLIEGLLKERQAALATKYYFAATNAERRLVVLEHVETIQECIVAIQRYPQNGANVVESSSTETTIPYLIPLLFQGSTIPDAVLEPPYRNGLTPRDRAALAITQALCNRLAFPDETRRWAENMRTCLPYLMREQRVNLVKQWWEHNKKALEERRYADATWLPAKYKGEPSYLGIEEMNELNEKRAKEVTDHRTPDAGFSSPTSAGKTGKASHVFDTAQSQVQTIGIILAASFVAIATLVWRLKRDHTKS